MDYHFRNEEADIKEGNYYIDAMNKVTQVILDEDRGYALLDIESGELVSDFYEDMKSFKRYTTILNKKEVVWSVRPQFQLK